VTSAPQVRRQARNEALRQLKAAAAPHRGPFLAPHAQVLMRFGATLPADGAHEGGSGADGGVTGSNDGGSSGSGSGGVSNDGGNGSGSSGGGGLFDSAMAACATLEPPVQLVAQMRDYQLHGLRWLAAMHSCGINAILADEMSPSGGPLTIDHTLVTSARGSLVVRSSPRVRRGLGKTLQTIALLAHVTFTLKEPGPHLVVAPLSVLSAWSTEFRRFCPAARVLKLHSSDSAERARLMATVEDPDAYDVAITTPEMAKAHNVQSKLAHRSWWNYLVIDEGHVVKNDQSQVSQALRKFHCAHCLLLTGTPLQNNLHELWALLNFLHP
jgi:hypothetical protein